MGTRSRVVEARKQPSNPAIAAPGTVSSTAAIPRRGAIFASTSDRVTPPKSPSRSGGVVSAGPRTKNIFATAASVTAPAAVAGFAQTKQIIEVIAGLPGGIERLDWITPQFPSHRKHQTRADSLVGKEGEFLHQQDERRGFRQPDVEPD